MICDVEVTLKFKTDEINIDDIPEQARFWKEQFDLAMPEADGSVKVTPPDGGVAYGIEWRGV